MLVLAAVLVWLGLNAFFVVQPDQQAVLARMGQVQPTVFAPGMHAKLPLLEHVVRVDTRSRMDNLPALMLAMADGSTAQVNVYVVWRVTQVGRYVAAAHGAQQREALAQAALGQLQESVHDGLQKLLAKDSLSGLITQDHRALLEQLARQINTQATATTGVEVQQLGLLDVTWPQAARAGIYARMQTPVAASTAKQVALGMTQVAQVKADTDAQTSVILADAYRKAQQIRAEGDTRAAGIYAASYGKNPEFYRFYRSMEAYRSSFASKQDVLVLSPDGDFFKYFRHLGGS